MPFLMKDPPSAWDPLFDRERLGSDPVEWAKRIPILDASQAHLRSSPLPEVERILAGERTRAQLNVLVDYLVDLAVKYVPHRFPDLEKPLNLSDHTLGDLPKS
jgi:hypothetical protein